MNHKLSIFAAHLRERIAQQPPAIHHEEFSQLALELFGLQFEHNSAYRKVCESRRITPNVVEHWTQIPALPTSAFKELELTSLAPEERTAVFHSSGTTGQEPSRHFHNAESLALYEASLWQGFQARFDAPGELIFLTPDAVSAPRSSLVHMFEFLRHKFGADKTAFTGRIGADGAWTLDFTAVRDALIARTQNPEPRPQLLLGTAFSFVHLLDYFMEKGWSFQLPAGSRVMETGGYKNRSRSMPKPELHALIARQLGVAPDNVICEYGMSELSSQAYSSESHHRAFRFPPWARAQIVSPEHGRELAEGETGLIRIFDLANVFSMAAIQTEDLGVRRGDGFELIGRAERAEPRGCSLMTA